jgi:hypothetical protein
MAESPLCHVRVDNAVAPEHLVMGQQIPGLRTVEFIVIVSSTMEILFIGSPTRSLLLPVLYLLTHNANGLSSQIHDPGEGTGFATVLSRLRLLVQSHG